MRIENYNLLITVYEFSVYKHLADLSCQGEKTRKVGIYAITFSSCIEPITWENDPRTVKDKCLNLTIPPISSIIVGRISKSGF